MIASFNIEIIVITDTAQKMKFSIKDFYSNFFSCCKKLYLDFTFKWLKFNAAKKRTCMGIVTVLYLNNKSRQIMKENISTHRTKYISNIPKKRSFKLILLKYTASTSFKRSNRTNYFIFQSGRDYQ